MKKRKCPYCGIKTKQNLVQYYPEPLYECNCGTIVDEKGNEKTEEYYQKG